MRTRTVGILGTENVVERRGLFAELGLRAQAVSQRHHWKSSCGGADCVRTYLALERDRGREHRCLLAVLVAVTAALARHHAHEVARVRSVLVPERRPDARADGERRGLQAIGGVRRLGVHHRGVARRELPLRRLVVDHLRELALELGDVGLAAAGRWAASLCAGPAGGAAGLALRAAAGAGAGARRRQTLDRLTDGAVPARHGM